MRRQVAGSLIAGVVAVLLGSCAASQKPTVDAAAIKSAIEGINQKYAAAVAARDTDAVAGLYAVDGRTLPPNGPRADGHDAIRALWAHFLSTPGLNLTFSSSDLTISEAGDMAVDVGAYHMTMDGPKGKPIEDVGKYVTIFKKVGDEWKISVDTFNSDKPMAAQ
jgi:uncharacterized protein (TIGR02246 family)